MTTTIEPYDFDRPAALAREQSRALEAAFETFARGWATHLTDKTRARSSVTVNQVKLSAYAEYIDQVPDGGLVAVCTVPDREQASIVTFPLTAALAWVAQMVGGKPDAAHAEGRGALTSIEQALVTFLMDGTLDHLGSALGGLYPEGIRLGSIQYDPQFAQLAPAGDLVVTADLSLSVAGDEMPASVMLPASLIIEQLSTSSPAIDADAEPRHVAYQVGETPLDVSVQIEPRTVTPDFILDLAIGDIITFPHAQSQPLNIVTGGVTVAHGSLGAVGARCACVITDAATPTGDDNPTEETR